MDENRKSINKKRKYESCTHIEVLKNNPRPEKFARIVIPGFKEYYSFKITKNKSNIQMLKPTVELGDKTNNKYPLKTWYKEYQDVKVRRSSKTEKRTSKFSLKFNEIIAEKEITDPMIIQEIEITDPMVIN